MMFGIVQCTTSILFYSSMNIFYVIRCVPGFLKFLPSHSVSQKVDKLGFLRLCAFFVVWVLWGYVHFLWCDWRVFLRDIYNKVDKILDNILIAIIHIGIVAMDLCNLNICKKLCQMSAMVSIKCILNLSSLNCKIAW